jgi:hypothetical protein
MEKTAMACEFSFKPFFAAAFPAAATGSSGPGATEAIKPINQGAF